MNLLKKTLLLFLIATVLCSSFSNAAHASNELPEVSPASQEAQNISVLSEETSFDLIIPEEDQNDTDPSENESENIPEFSDAYTETAPMESEPPILSSNEESISDDKSGQEDELTSSSEITEEISETYQNDAIPLTTDSETEITIIEPYTEIYVNPLYEDLLQPSDLVQPIDTAIATYINEEYLSTPEDAGVQLRTSMLQRQETINIFYQIPADQDISVQDIMEQALIHTKNPAEGDYLRWNMGGYITQIKGYMENNIKYLTLQYTPTYYTTAAQEAELTTDIRQVINQLDLNPKNDYEKICTIYDYICQNVTYDYDNLNDSTYMLKHTAYAALKHHTAVCQGYALLFYRLALEVGINNRIISGTSSSQKHGWNIVHLDNVYYNVDSTWDAPRKQTGRDYAFFLKCDGNFPDHTRDSQYSDNSFYSIYPMGTSDYSLCKTDLSSGAISLSNTSYVYDGTEKKPSVTVRYNAKTLVPDSDYRVLYQNNLNIGKASVTITGIGAYTGTMTAFFDIIRPTEPQPATQGWKIINGKWYYYINGIRQIGWLKLGTTWYYLNSSGAMATGWLKLGNTWYYLNSSGAMATSDTTINGTINQFNSSGAWLGTRS